MSLELTYQLADGQTMIAQVSSEVIQAFVEIKEKAFKNGFFSGTLAIKVHDSSGNAKRVLHYQLSLGSDNPSDMQCMEASTFHAIPDSKELRKCSDKQWCGTNCKQENDIVIKTFLGAEIASDKVQRLVSLRRKAAQEAFNGTLKALNNSISIPSSEQVREELAPTNLDLTLERSAREVHEAVMDMYTTHTREEQENISRGIIVIMPRAENNA